MVNPTWEPRTSLHVLEVRALFLTLIRQFFIARDILEVETPALGSHASIDANVSCISCLYPAAAGLTKHYLQPSPEYAMKRLLAHESRSIYQLCKVFREGEFGRWHNPEFTMLEWYRVEWDYQALAAETEQLIKDLLQPHRQLDASEVYTYQSLFQTYADINPLSTSTQTLKKLLQAHDINPPETDYDGFLQLVQTHLIEPKLPRNKLIRVIDYPESQAALARTRKTAKTMVAERFEIFLDGVELANGYQELTDVVEQRARFQRELDGRSAQSNPLPIIDERFMAAMASGLPECAGVAVGVDRVLALALGHTGIHEVITFPFDRI